MYILYQPECIAGETFRFGSAYGGGTKNTNHQRYKKVFFFDYKWGFLSM